MKFEAALELPTTPVRAQWFQAWLFSRCKAVERLVFHVSCDDDDPSSDVLAARASRWVPVALLMLLDCPRLPGRKPD